MKKKDTDDLLRNMEDAWDFLFFFQVIKYINSNNLKDKAVVQVMINKILGDFKMKSISVVQNLVDDLLLENMTQSPKILKVNKKEDETHIFSIEAENDDLHIKIYFPQTRVFEYYNPKSNEFEEANIVDSDYFKVVKREFNSLQVLFDKIINIREENNGLKFVIPLSSLIDYKGLRIRVTTLTFSKGDGIKWGFNEMGRMVQEPVVSKTHLDLLSKILNLKDGYVKQYNMNQGLQKGDENVRDAPEYSYKINPMLKIFLNYNMSLEHFQSSNIKNSFKTSSPDMSTKGVEILYIKEVGDINPPDCNFYFNPGQTMLQNLNFIEENQSSCDYLQMAKNMTIKEKYIYRLSSKVRTTKTHRKEFMDIMNSDPSTAKLTESGFLGYLDENCNFGRHQINIQLYCNSDLPTEKNMVHSTKLSKNLYYK